MDGALRRVSVAKARSKTLSFPRTAHLSLLAEPPLSGSNLKGRTGPAAPRQNAGTCAGQMRDPAGRVIG